MASETPELLEGPVLEVLPKLLAQGRTQEVLDAVRALVARNEELERRLAATLGRRSMKANEGVSSAQLLLFLEELSKQAERVQDEELAAKAEDEALHARAEAAAERARQKALAEKAKPKPGPLKKPLPAELPRRDNVIEVPEAERACPSCGGQRTVIGYEVSETLEFEPARLYVRRDKQEKRACRPCEGAPVRAPRGPKIVAGGQIGISVAVQIVSDKYEIGLPLHRQARTFKRLGMKLSVSTMADQVRWVAELLKPLHCEAIDQVIASKIKHLDGSGLKVLDRNHAKGKRTGTLWSSAGGPSIKPVVAAYQFASTKKAKKQRDGELGPGDILAQFEGYVVLDADILFHAERQREDLLDCGCNMHARRYLVKALEADSCIYPGSAASRPYGSYLCRRACAAGSSITLAASGERVPPRSDRHHAGPRSRRRHGAGAGPLCAGGAASGWRRDRARGSRSRPRRPDRRSGSRSRPRRRPRGSTSAADDGCGPGPRRSRLGPQSAARPRRSRTPAGPRARRNRPRRGAGARLGGSGSRSAAGLWSRVARGSPRRSARGSRGRDRWSRRTSRPCSLGSSAAYGSKR